MKKKNKEEETNEILGIEEQEERIIIPKIKSFHSDLITMEAFLSNSKEVKQKYNSYMPVGFRRWVTILRSNEPKFPFRQTKEQWMELFRKYSDN